MDSKSDSGDQPTPPSSPSHHTGETLLQPDNVDVLSGLLDNVLDYMGFPFWKDLREAKDKVEKESQRLQEETSSASEGEQQQQNQQPHQQQNLQHHHQQQQHQQTIKSRTSSTSVSTVSITKSHPSRRPMPIDTPSASSSSSPSSSVSPSTPPPPSTSQQPVPQNRHVRPTSFTEVDRQASKERSRSKPEGKVTEERHDSKTCKTPTDPKAREMKPSKTGDSDKGKDEVLALVRQMIPRPPVSPLKEIKSNSQKPKGTDEKKIMGRTSSGEGTRESNGPKSIAHKLDAASSEAESPNKLKAKNRRSNNGDGSKTESKKEKHCSKTEEHNKSNKERKATEKDSKKGPEDRRTSQGERATNEESRKKKEERRISQEEPATNEESRKKKEERRISQEERATNEESRKKKEERRISQGERAMNEESRKTKEERRISQGERATYEESRKTKEERRISQGERATNEESRKKREERRISQGERATNEESRKKKEERRISQEERATNEESRKKKEERRISQGERAMNEESRKKKEERRISQEERATNEESRKKKEERRISQEDRATNEESRKKKEERRISQGERAMNEESRKTKEESSTLTKGRRTSGEGKRKSFPKEDGGKGAIDMKLLHADGRDTSTKEGESSKCEQSVKKIKRCKSLPNTNAPSSSKNRAVDELPVSETKISTGQHKKVTNIHTPIQADPMTNVDIEPCLLQAPAVTMYDSVKNRKRKATLEEDDISPRIPKRAKLSLTPPAATITDVSKKPEISNSNGMRDSMKPAVDMPATQGNSWRNKVTYDANGVPSLTVSIKTSLISPARLAQLKRRKEERMKEKAAQQSLTTDEQKTEERMKEREKHRPEMKDEQKTAPVEFKIPKKPRDPHRGNHFVPADSLRSPLDRPYNDNPHPRNNDPCTSTKRDKPHPLQNGTSWSARDKPHSRHNGAHPPKNETSSARYNPRPAHSNPPTVTDNPHPTQNGAYTSYSSADQHNQRRFDHSRTMSKPEHK